MSFNKDDCIIWKKDKLRNPRNKRKLNPDAKKGIYNQLTKICALLLKDHDSHAPETDDNLEADRLRLIRAVRKAIKPILHKTDTTEMRIKYNNIISNYLKNVKPCLDETVVQVKPPPLPPGAPPGLPLPNYKPPVSELSKRKYLIDIKKLALNDKNNEPIVIFDKRIGSESAYGVAYMNMGKRFANLLKFSCKLMSVTRDNTMETKILKEMSKLVINGITPNLPLTYNILKCNTKCKIQLCPQVTHSKYYVVMSELANCDIQNWFKEVHTINEYMSVILQLLISVQTFHNMGYIHNDTHLGNFLIHKIKPGGFWHYVHKTSTRTVDIYIPNTGYLLVIWDPGLANKKTNIYNDTVHIKNDMTRPLRLINRLGISEKYIELGLKPVPDSIQAINTILVDTINNGVKLHEILSIPGFIDNKKVTKESIINSKPYIL